MAHFWQRLQDIFRAEDDGVLSEDKFKKLDELIEHTNAYSAFLYEQMQENDEEEGPAEKAKAGNKRKATNAAQRSKKRAKTESQTSVSPHAAVFSGMLQGLAFCK